MKFEKKLFIFGSIVLMISVCLLLYISFGWNDDAKSEYQISIYHFMSTLPTCIKPETMYNFIASIYMYM